MGADTAELLVNSDVNSSVAEARAQYTARRQKSADLHQKARAVMPGGNTRSVLSYGPFPTAMARGEDCRLWDIDGHEYLDLCGEYTAGLFGHSEPRIHAAIAAAVANGLNLAAVGEPEVALAGIICGRFPSIELIRFTNSGTEGNLMALTAARAFTGRDTILVFDGGYHGGVLTFPFQAPSRVTAPFPVVIAEYNDTAGTVALIREHAETLAAVIIEPMLGGGGCIPARPEFLAALREATSEIGALLIFDEVMTSRMEPRPFTRLITPEHAKLVAETGGMIGVWPVAALFPDMAALAGGMARMAGVVGVEHVGLGTDSMGLVGAATFESYAELPGLVAALLGAGFGAGDVRKLLGGNYARVFAASVG